LRPASAVLPLPVAMIEPTFRTPLVSPIGAAPLPAPGLIAAGAAAVALSTITAEQRKNRARHSLPGQTRGRRTTSPTTAMRIRKAALDNGL
jgi:hypothetical protein